jgi:hypothetical protein
MASLGVGILTFAAVCTCSVEGRPFPLETLDLVKKNESGAAAVVPPVRDTDTKDKDDPVVPVDHTLAIVAPIAAGIFLMVLVFFLYIISEGNVADESMDYETLEPPDGDGEDQDEDMLPTATASTSGSGSQSQGHGQGPSA